MISSSVRLARTRDGDEVRAALCRATSSEVPQSWDNAAVNSLLEMAALPKEARGQGMAITRMCSDVVGLGAPVALGLLADSTSCGAAIGSSAITMTGCTLYFLMRARDPSRR